MTTGEKTKLLVVDDEEFNRDLLSRRLERAGYEVTSAASAAEALVAIQRGECELVLLDNMMPGMTGIDLLRLLRATWSASQLPVIMVTAITESESVIEALNLGANDYVTKPVDFPVALARIKTQITRRQSENALRQSEERFALAARGANDGLWDWDLRTGVIYFSARWKEMIGYGDHEIPGEVEQWLSRVHPEDALGLKKTLETMRAPGGPGELVSEFRLLHRDGSYRWMMSRGTAQRNAAGDAVRMAGSTTDLTRNKAFDALTGLPNRVQFQEALAHELRELRGGRASGLFVLFFDLDRFKLVNDSLGHQAGDALLTELSQRIRASVRRRPGRARDMIARIGGDEFAVMLTGCLDAGEAEGVAARILESVRRPSRQEGREIFPSASIGLVEATAAHIDAKELLRDADTAMYRAKAAGPGRVVSFAPFMRAQALERLELEGDLKGALERQEFRLHYQPKINLATGTLVGFEALVRWQHPTRGLLQPNSFIALAEETGQIVPLGEWVLRQSCETVSIWQQQHPMLPPIEVSVNLSVRQLREPGLVEQARAILAETAIPPSSLQLEVTESILIGDFTQAGLVLAGLKALGVGLKIDDFGTGYSSFQYLMNLPFDTLKIDRSFVTKMCEDTQSLDVVRTIIELAKSLGMEVVAEGVETREQAARLLQLGCEFGQGFYFSRPVPGDEAMVMIQGGSGIGDGYRGD